MQKGVYNMKKLIAVLLPLLVSVSAMAEDVATKTDIAGESSLLGNGLIVTAGGLCGVFLVLILFFFTIKLMQKILK